MSLHSPSLVFFFFNDTATTEIYTLSLHDALPIYHGGALISLQQHKQLVADPLSRNPPQTRTGRLDRRLQPRSEGEAEDGADRKSTRLNSSHLVISYAVFCLKKKKILTVY